MLNGGIVAAAEGGAILIAFCSRDGRVLVHVSIIDVGLPMVFKVLAGTFDAIVIAASFDVSVLGGRCVHPAWSWYSGGGGPCATIVDGTQTEVANASTATRPFWDVILISFYRFRVSIGLGDWMPWAFVSVVCKRVRTVDVYGRVNWLPEAVVFPARWLPMCLANKKGHGSAFEGGACQ